MPTEDDLSLCSSIQYLRAAAIVELLILNAELFTLTVALSFCSFAMLLLLLLSPFTSASLLHELLSPSCFCGQLPNRK